MSDTVTTWEVISPFNRLDRIRVPGGWLYRTAHGGDAVALCFVPLAPEEIEPSAPRAGPAR
jgi:hypothetical protein